MRYTGTAPDQDIGARHRLHIDFPPLADHTLDILPGHLLFRRFKDLLSRAASVIFSADPLTPLFWNG